jgi:heterodisulfide reductase subunit A
VDFKFEERGSFHILIAHHDPEVRSFIDQSLAKENFPLHWASSGEEALQRIEQTQDLGLVLLAVDMPDIQAQRILQRGLECQNELQVVILCETEQKGQARELLTQGARETLFWSQAVDFPAWLDKLYMRIISEETRRLEVGAVILACGFECYDPSPVHDILGYQDMPQVITALEFERLISSTGPTQGLLQRPDGKQVRSIAWLQCVGSRDLQKGADFCSSICCMFAIKEAMLAKERCNHTIFTSIFALDIRSFGKGYQRYRDPAEQEHGVRFVRARPHSVLSDGLGGALLRYVDQTGQVSTEHYDLVVLSTGVRPTRDMPALVQALGLKENDFGFCQTEPLAPTRTSQFGVYASGAFAEPKDIADTVIQASAAALEASRLISLYSAPRPVEQEPEPAYRRVENEAPSTLVVICDACPTLQQSVDMQALTDKLQGMATVQSVARVPHACTEAGWQRIEERVREDRPNRIVIGACLPYAHVPKLRELGRTVGLNPAFMEVVDIYTPTFPDMPLSPEQRLQEIISALGAAVVKVQHACPAPLLQAVPVVPKALVVGGGLAGMTAALAIADHGLEVCLVEEESELGGTAGKLRFTLEGADPQRFVQDLVQQVQKHPHIHVLTESRVTLSTGRAGQFLSAVQTGEGQSLTVEHGATILATGGAEATSHAYGYGPRKNIYTQLQFEDQLASGALDARALSGVVMIQCVECRQEPRNYCSRVCCPTSIKHALSLKKKNPRLPVYILYRDLMTYGFQERHFTEARRLGVVFIRYSPESMPQVQDLEKGFQVRVQDTILQRSLEIQADTLVLATGIVPHETEELRIIFRVQADRDGFLQEAESKWRPVEFLRQGVFLCGLARAPGIMRETVASAKAAAQRALRLLSHGHITGGTITAEVKHSLCSLCQTCISVCPYGARSVDWEKEIIQVDEILCQGCGACTAMCPNSAAFLRGFPDDQVLAEIDAALGAVP